MPPVPARKPTPEEVREQRIRAARLAMFDRILKEALDG
jgi:hypothetical protein